LVEGVGEKVAENVGREEEVRAGVGGEVGVAAGVGVAGAVAVPPMSIKPLAPPSPTPPPPLLVVGVLRRLGRAEGVGVPAREWVTSRAVRVANKGREAEGVPTVMTEVVEEGVRVLPPPPSLSSPPPPPPPPGGVMVVDRVWVTDTRVGRGVSEPIQLTTGVGVVEGEGEMDAVREGVTGEVGVAVKVTREEALPHPLPLGLTVALPEKLPEPEGLGEREGEEDPVPGLLKVGVRESRAEGVSVEEDPPPTWGDSLTPGLGVVCSSWVVGVTPPVPRPRLPVLEVEAAPLVVDLRVGVGAEVMRGEREVEGLALSLPSPPPFLWGEGVKEGEAEVVMDAGAGVRDDPLPLPEGLPPPPPPPPRVVRVGALEGVGAGVALGM
jgi:hypothetical protein